MASSTVAPLLLFFLLLLPLSSSSSSSRPLLLPHPDSSYIDSPLSDLDLQALGLLDSSINAAHPDPFPPLSNSSSSSSSSCEPPYGFLPCTDTLLGNLFLLAVYGYLLFVAARLLSEGSELLLTVLDAGIIGGLLLPILGSLPDSILILVSGLGGTQAEAQEQVLVGIGLLAGSIVMLLTVLWGSCLLLGRCDLEVVEDKLTAIDKTLTRQFDLTTTGVENDELTTLSARIMIVSILPFIVASLPMIFDFSATGNIPVLVACVLAFAGLLSYCLYQIFSPWIQERRKEIAQKMVLKAGALQHLLKRSGNASLINEHGNLDEAVANELFDKIDLNHDKLVERKELQLMLTVSLVSHGDVQALTMVDQIMHEYDTDRDNKLTRDEFLDGLRKWCRELKLERQSSIAHSVADARTYLNDLERIEAEEKEEEEGENIPPTKSQIIRKAVLLLIAGTVLAAVFADPLVDSVNDFSTASNIPSFFISFVLLPLASNSSEAVSSILFATRKKKKNISLTYSQIYGGVTMNCTMGLGIFLAVVYGRQLVWDFSSEVLVICLVVILMGLLASFRRVFPTWMAGIALILYPISLGIVAVLDYVFGWE